MKNSSNKPAMIKREDIAEVRARAKLDEIVGEHVTLRTAGMGSLKGLCPFHDEKTPSFNVRPQIGRYTCFGCGESGDVIEFVIKINSMSFVEAVEYLAQRYSVELHYENSNFAPSQAGSSYSARQRLLAAHDVAQGFFQTMLATPEAQTAREFLISKGFAAKWASHFKVGYAPKGWDTTLRELRKHGFSEEELITAGLAVKGKNGIYDRFRGRVMWPIRDLTGKTIGFGARKLYDNDQGPKYLNTPETPIYKKSQVLYGLDLARKDISTLRNVVIMEGYTDVMAAHKAGITTAVATCGTAFSTEHASLIRRIIGDTQAVNALKNSLNLNEAITGAGSEVIFTFDGDEAGQKAALKAFAEDQRFLSQTYVASDPQGMDPCDIALLRGEEELRHVIANRIPMFEFVIRTVLKQFDLKNPEGQIEAMRLAAPVVAQIRDHALRPEYARRLAGWLGLDEKMVHRAVTEAVKSNSLPQNLNSQEYLQQRDSTQLPRYYQPRDPRTAIQVPVGGLPEAAINSENSVAATSATSANSSLTSVRLAEVMRAADANVLVEAQVLAIMLQQPSVLNLDQIAQIPEEAFKTGYFQDVWDYICAAGMLELAIDGTYGVKEMLQTVIEIAPPEKKELVNDLAMYELPAQDKEQVKSAAKRLLESLSILKLEADYAELRIYLKTLDPLTEETKYEQTLSQLHELSEKLRVKKQVIN